MELIDSLKHLFSPKQSLKDLKVDDLRRERIRLEQTERKLVDDINRIEEQKKQLFLKGKDESSERQRVIIARKIKELDVQAQNYDKSLSFISRQTRIINGFLQLKENEKLMAESGLSSMIAKIDLNTLQQYVDQASVDGVFHMDKLQEMLGALEQGDRMSSVVGAGEDKDVADIVALMQQAKEAESNPAEVDNALNEMNTRLKAKDKEPGEAA